MGCKTRCEGEFPADDGAALCGHNPGVIAEAVMNMVIGVTNGAISSGLLISSMVANGVDTDSLVNTIQAFANMGKPFAYKTCPLPGRRSAGEKDASGVCGNFNSSDCVSEFRNAQDSGSFDGFCSRCSTEQGASPLRSRCSLCC